MVGATRAAAVAPSAARRRAGGEAMAGMVAAEAAPLQVMSLRGVFYAAEAHSSRVGHIGLRGARYSRLWCVVVLV